MKVFKVVCDVNEYQYFLPNDEHSVDELDFRGLAKQNDWKVPSLFILMPLLRRGNFFDLLGFGTLILDKSAVTVLHEHNQLVPQVFPFRHEGDEYFLWNNTHCINVLDKPRCVFEKPAHLGTSNMHALKHAFLKNRMTETSVFKVPELPTAIFTYTGLKGPEDEFKTIVEDAGLQGLMFEEVYSD